VDFTQVNYLTTGVISRFPTYTISITTLVQTDGISIEIFFQRTPSLHFVPIRALRGDEDETVILRVTVVT